MSRDVSGSLKSPTTALSRSELVAKHLSFIFLTPQRSGSPWTAASPSIDILTFVSYSFRTEFRRALFLAFKHLFFSFFFLSTIGFQ